MSVGRTFRRLIGVVAWTIGAMIAWIVLLVAPLLIEIYGQRHFGWKPLSPRFSPRAGDWWLIAIFCGLPPVGVSSFLLALNGKLPGTSNRPRPAARGFPVEPARTNPSP